MNTLQENNDLMQLLEVVALEFQNRCKHEHAEHLKDDAYFCRSCGSLVQQHELTER